MKSASVRKFLLIIPLFVIVLLSSCELFSPKVSEGKLHILVYGNNYGKFNYKPVNGLIDGTRYVVSELYGTVNDAVQVGNALSSLAAGGGIEYDIRYLISDYSMKGKGAYAAGIKSMPESDVVCGTSKSDFQNEISRIAGISEPGDTTIIFYSGHGWITSSNKEVSYETDNRSNTGFILCKGDGSDFEFYRADEFFSDISAIEGAVVLFSDSCHSGGFVNQGYVSVVGDEYDDMDERTLFYSADMIDESSSVFTLSACRYYEESFERNDKWWHGYFTQSLLDALGWDEGDGINDLPCLKEPACIENHMVTFTGIAHYIIRHDGKESQHPSLNGGSNDLILFRY